MSTHNEEGLMPIKNVIQPTPGPFGPGNLGRDSIGQPQSEADFKPPWLIDLIGFLGKTLFPQQRLDGIF
jgi:hypothetical protein